MNGMGLSDAAVAERRKYIQAGDAADIMAGNWRKVWREKKGLAVPDDLSGVLPVQMGIFTEPFNLAWCERQTGRRVEYFTGSDMLAAVWQTLTGRPAHSDELQVSETHPFMACNLDGITTTSKGHPCVIDAKHVGRADEQMVLRYTPGMVHQATVMECDWWELSVFVGNSKWELIEQEVDEFYRADLISRCREFWGYVERDEEPPEVDATLPPKPQRALRTVQLEDQWRAEWPNWGAQMAELLGTWATTHAAATAHNIAGAEAVALMPEDVGLITRGRIKFARDKAGIIRKSLLKGGEKNDG